MKICQKMRKFVTLLAVAAMLIGLPGLSPLRASAAGPVTYAVKYLPDKREWHYQSNTSTFDDKATHRELYYLRQELKAGDVVVVYNDSDSAASLDLGSVQLSNLTVARSKAVNVIYSGTIDNCYLLDGASCAINADITNANIYDNVICNFNKNVKELNLYPLDKMTGNINCLGTVDHLYVASRSTGRIYQSLYSFQKGTFNITNGALATAADKYSTAPAAAATLTRENFDYVRYANDYPDVKAAFGLNATALYKHYVTCGVKEGRKAYATTTVTTTLSASTFDYVRYADKNPDLKAAFGYDAKALYNHYITLGINENRGSYSIYDSFDYLRYANDYPDLKAAFGYDAKALYQHYTTCGIKEGRGDYSK